MSLNLTASDPQNAQVIISGAINGIAFACPAGNTTCSIPLSDGQGNITYRVDSSTGLSDSDTTTYKKDSTTPQISGSVSGASGLNNWYTSATTLSATSTDSTSSISTFEMNINNSGWVNYAETTFNDGIHTIQYRATDNAGNVTETAVQEIKVDTTTPNLSLSTNGTKGQNDWYTSQTSVTPTSTDSGSGVASIEYKLNNGSFNLYTSPLQFIDGIHTYQFKITDNAGNITTTPSLTLKVDTIAPIVDMDDEINLGDRLYYEPQDDLSGLWINRTVIEDEDEKYKKIVWLEEISGYKVEGDILWDGKFKDGTTAPVGEYFITLKIADQAGNETFRTAIVNVNPFSYILPITPFTPPTTNTELPSNELTSNEQEESFGNENNGNPSNETSSTNVGGETVFANTIAQAGTLTSFTSGGMKIPARQSQIPIFCGERWQQP